MVVTPFSFVSLIMLDKVYLVIKNCQKFIKKRYYIFSLFFAQNWSFSDQNWSPFGLVFVLGFFKIWEHCSRFKGFPSRKLLGRKTFTPSCLPLVGCNLRFFIWVDIVGGTNLFQIFMGVHSFTRYVKLWDLYV